MDFTQFLDSWKNAEAVAGAETPQGLTPEQLIRMKARVTAGNQLGVKNALTDLAGRTGGTNNPLFALTSARMQAGATSTAAGQMADVDVAEAQKKQDLEMQRRSQVLSASGLGAQLSGNMSSNEIGLGNIDVDKKRLSQAASQWAQELAFNKEKLAAGNKQWTDELSWDKEKWYGPDYNGGSGGSNPFPPGSYGYYNWNGGGPKVLGGTKQKSTTPVWATSLGSGR